MTAPAASTTISHDCASAVGRSAKQPRDWRIEQGKGRTDRYALLTERLLDELRAYSRVARPAPWLFPGPGQQRPVTTRTALRAYVAAKRRAGITKRGGIHALL